MGPRDQKNLSGLVLGRSPRIPRDYTSRVRAAIHRFESGVEEAADRQKSIEGMVAHVKRTDLARAKPPVAAWEGKIPAAAQHGSGVR